MEVTKSENKQSATNNITWVSGQRGHYISVTLVKHTGSTYIYQGLLFAIFEFSICS